jgi:predicted DNA repair protein MutK
MIGGAFLCFEGFEKIAHKLLHAKDEEAHEAEIKEAYQKSLPKVPKTSYCGLLGTKEGFAILKQMSWVEIEELTDYEFFGE